MRGSSKERRLSAEQIVVKLREAEVELAKGHKVPEVVVLSHVPPAWLAG